MERAALLGRVAFSVVCLSSGINHLTKRRYLTEYARSMGVPAGPEGASA
jgi:hypothetical protein